jgi:hypothetical protein
MIVAERNSALKNPVQIISLISEGIVEVMLTKDKTIKLAI